MFSATCLAQAPDNDLLWVDDPRSWHQQACRIVDHRFSTVVELKSFALRAKQAGVSSLMLVQVQQTKMCPGGWYNGLRLCEHINGTFPAADGTIQAWKEMLAELKPMRLSWWANLDYWSVQGPVWAQAKAAPKSPVGEFFSWNATAEDECWGPNPDGAQGSWGSDGQGKGWDSALASWGSTAYADYLVDALANSWTTKLGIDSYCIDCLTCYQKGNPDCKSGMLQTPNGDALAAWSQVAKWIRLT